MLRVPFLLIVLIVPIGCASRVEDVPTIGAAGSATGSKRAAEDAAPAEGESLDRAAVFARLDADADEKLTGDEIPGWLASIEDIDSDRDGAITFEEMQARVEPFAARDQRDFGGGDSERVADGTATWDPTMAFANMDTNQDGKLAGDEIRSFMRNDMEGFDPNGDGDIGRDEFLDRIRRGGFGRGRGRRGEGGRPERPQRPESE